MNADQLSEIRPALREVIEGPRETCVTLEVDGEPDKWVQVTDCTINVAYPHFDSPESRVGNMLVPLVSASLKSWEAGKFATFEFDEISVIAISDWIDAYFVGVLGCPEGEYRLDIVFHKL